jgi:ADP-ribosylglycohydrolase
MILERYRLPDLAWSPGGGAAGQLDPDAFRDRVAGSLLAGALGDGLGSPVEGWSRDHVRAVYGPAGVTDLPPEGATWTDDTQLTAVVGDSLVAAGGRFDPDDFVGRLVAWLPRGRGVGRATCEAVQALGAGEPWQEVGARIDSSGNGAAMRTAPVGLVHALDGTPAALLSDAVLFAVPTHGGQVGVAATVAMAAGVGYLARAGSSGATGLDRGELVDFMATACGWVETAPTPTRRPPITPTYLRDRLRELAGWLGRDPDDVFAESWTGAFALESVPAALYAFLRSPDDPRRVLLTAANASHDTDTIASMAGNLAGAWLGAARIARELPDWWARIEGRDGLLRLAEELAGLALEGGGA